MIKLDHLIQVYLLFLYLSELIPEPASRIEPNRNGVTRPLSLWDELKPVRAV